MSTHGRSPRGSAAALGSVVALVAIMWLLELIDAILAGELDQYGIIGREADSLPGIVFAPFLHADLAHLSSNTLPFVVLGALVAWRNPESFWRILAVITLGGGAVVWLLGPADAITLGASGVIFGFLAYLLVAGVRTRHLVDVIVAVVVLALYGSAFLAALPVGAGPGISWLAHLAGAGAGVVAALRYAPVPQPVAPPMR